MTVDQLIHPALELRVIGTALSSRAAVEAYVSDHGLAADHFTHDTHRTLWAVIRHRLETNGTIDDVTLDETVRRNPALAVGGVTPEQVMATAAVAVAEGDPSPNGEHAELLKDLAERRRLHHALNMAGRTLLQPEVPVSDTVTTVTEQLLSGSLARRGPQVLSARDAIERALQSRRWEILDGTPGLTFGFRGLDAVMSMRPGQVTVVAARPSCGKSLWTQQVISHVVHQHQARALLFSMEMLEDELIDRLVAHEARVPGRWLTYARKAADRDADRWERIVALSDDTALDRYEFVDDVDVTGVDIATIVRRRKAIQPDLQLVAVDYLGLIRRTDPRQLPVHALDEITRQLKIVAIQQKVAVLLLAQLSRANETERRRPKLSDLRDSGGIEQNADNVLFLHAEPRSAGFGEQDEPPAANELIVAKNRSGKRKLILPIDFDPGIPRFVDPGPPAAPPVPPAPPGVPYPDLPLPETS